MPYSEKQIAEWAVKVADEYTDNADYTGPLAPLLESKVRTLIAAVRKETREECARDASRLLKALQDTVRLAGKEYDSNPWAAFIHGTDEGTIVREEIAATIDARQGGDDVRETSGVMTREPTQSMEAAPNAAIRNLQEREEG